MRRSILLGTLLLLPSLGISSQMQMEIDRSNVSVKIPKNISPKTTLVPHNVEKPDLTVSKINAHIKRGEIIWDEVKEMYVNEALEVDVTIDNVLAYHGLSRNDFKVKVEFRYGYSGPVHKEKIVWVRKNLEPGESITKRIVYGKVKSTPDVLYIRAIADSSNSVIEGNENNNVKEIAIKIKNPN